MSAPNIPAPLLAQLELPAQLAILLMEAAADSVRSGFQHARRPRRPRRGDALKPGAETPLWNELANAVRAEIRRHGERARLGRVLGVPRQRVTEMLRTRSYLPDAERTLLLLVWLQLRREGRDLC